MALTPEEIFEKKIAEKLQVNASKTAGMNAIYQFDVTGDQPQTWLIDLTQPEGGKVVKGGSDQAKCTVTISSSDLSDLVEGKLNPQMAFMSGKLKVKGDMGLALKLGNIL